MLSYFCFPCLCGEHISKQWLLRAIKAASSLVVAYLRGWFKLGIHIFFLFPLKNFDVCLKLVVHPQFIHSLRCLFCAFICQLLLLLLSEMSHLFLHRDYLRISLVTLSHFLLILPTLSLMRVQVASASSCVSRWGLLTNMVGSRRGWAR